MSSLPHKFCDLNNARMPNIVKAGQIVKTSKAVINQVIPQAYNLFLEQRKIDKTI